MSQIIGSLNFYCFFPAPEEIRAFSNSAIYTANKARYIYIYTVGISPYFCACQQKKGPLFENM